MYLIDQWRRVAAKAWSVRLAVLAAGLSGIEVFTQLVMPAHPAPWLAALAGLVSLTAALARIVAQPEMRNGNP